MIFFEYIFITGKSLLSTYVYLPFFYSCDQLLYGGDSSINFNLLSSRLTTILSARRTVHVAVDDHLFDDLEILWAINADVY